jgi:hypothetical protein
MKTILAAMAFCALASSAMADETGIPGKTITESEVSDLATAHYFDLLAGGTRTYRPEDIMSGLQRHRTEWRARLVQDGYTILPNELARAPKPKLPSRSFLL